MNVVGYRLIHGQSIILPRSHCITCHTTLIWYDMIPILSWFLLRGHCRFCSAPISWLYPFIEFITVVLMAALYIYTPHAYFWGYFIFFSALIVTIRSDLETLLISRYMTLFLIPIGFLLSLLKMIPITPFESLIGALGGYFFLYGLAYLFWRITGKEGMGQGDWELLACIGSFIGPLGCWFSLLIGSIMGSIFGIAYVVWYTKDRSIKIPFGPFLACGACLYVLFQGPLLKLFLID